MSNQDINVVECRICHSRTTKDLILSPCLCKGSMGFVHIGCLEQWLNISSHTFCELCSYRFEVIQVRRYSFCQSVGVWIRQDNPSLYKALFFVVISSINSTLLCWMWFLWLSNSPISFSRDNEALDEENKSAGKEEKDIGKPKWIVVFIFLTLLTGFSVKSLCFDTYKIMKEQCRAWYRWWNETVNVRLVLDLQNYKLNAKLEEGNDLSFKLSQDSPQSGQENSVLEEIKIVDIENKDSNKLHTELPGVHSVPKITEDVQNNT